MHARPAYVGNVADLARDIGKDDLRARAAPLGKALGLQRLGVHHEIIPPGCRSSEPHAHSHEEEFVYVIQGAPDLWADGVLHRLQPGDGVAFPAGTGIAHCLINNSAEPVRLLIVGEHNVEDRTAYPVDPQRPNPRPWTDWPGNLLGPHDGRPDALRSST
jgi:uncharacterized cupin superfamily protein